MHRKVFDDVEPPRIGERFYCVQCDSATRIKSWDVEYYARCTQKGCKFSRRNFMHRAQAQASANRHHYKSKHPVKFGLRGDSGTSVIGRPTEDQPTLPGLDDDAPPF